MDSRNKNESFQYLHDKFKPDVTLLTQEKSLVTMADEFKASIDKLIRMLTLEIRSCWPYAHKQRKNVKRDFLYCLREINFTDATSFKKEVDKILEAKYYAEALIGSNSRTRKLVEEIESTLKSRDEVYNTFVKRVP